MYRTIPMCFKLIKMHLLYIFTITTKSTRREEIDFSCKQTKKNPNEYCLGSLAMLVSELVPIPLKADSKIIQTLFLRNDVHIICWQAFSMTTVVVLCIFFCKITFVSVLHKREWSRVRLLVQKLKKQKQTKTHKNTKALGSMHFDRAGINQTFLSSHLSNKHTQYKTTHWENMIYYMLI